MIVCHGPYVLASAVGWTARLTVERGHARGKQPADLLRRARREQITGVFPARSLPGSTQYESGIGRSVAIVIELLL